MRRLPVTVVVGAAAAALAVLAVSERPLGARVIGLLVICLGAGISVTAAVASARARRQRFGGREDLGIGGVYREYYAPDGVDEVAFAQVWSECAETLGVPPGKLRPTDRFDRELHGLDRLQVTGDAVGYLFDDATTAAKRAGLPFDSGHVVTLDDLIRDLLHVESRQAKR